jgi:hypothetical protein
MGSEHAHLLTNRDSSPPGLKLYGAGQAPLACIKTGTMTLSLGALEGVPGVMSRRLVVQHVYVAHFRVGMVSASWDAPPPAKGAPGAAQVRRGSRLVARNGASEISPPVPVHRRQQEVHLLASRLAYALPTFSSLLSVASDLVETGDEDGFFSMCKAHSSSIE